ncbi:Glycoside hydrolase family 2 immunoglobulin-like beta-sandwich [Penicillium coprophilum]|uniref:Glycoside hydrolase family 2 immunoglobulin-like beta-sandwich n=1 Tax=Penicillium coprophilum TaxID=36646 RepID=UPI002391138F|nr:Glycoside hydrolase family 2 immunoglobulin-like beta-sandwich [Penicillium coprophilum]KAJ5158794.1 Glycoside hydrolase family 2 immunoglobulin-like beta-sandwich [Penicillium coprophilum]
MKFSKQILSTEWTFKDRDDETPDAWMPVAAVPSTVQQDLIANKKLEDPYIGFNELKARWVNEKVWVYRHVFQRPEIPAGATAALVFDGLDTFASVKLNGETILESSNMFLGYRVDITNALGSAKSTNVLEIEFDCAQLKAIELRKKDPDHKWHGFNGDMARLGVRKAQYHWGWDWGPVIMTAGIWREARLEVYSARVEDLWPQTQLSSDHKTATVTAVAKIDQSNSEGSVARFKLTLRGQEIAQVDVPVPADKKAQASFEVTDPELWWPHGYGPQTLYEVSVSLLNDGNELHQVSKKFGIRSAEVIQQPDKHGKSFFFRINGLDIFCGGSCWIPADNLLPSITAERYRKWIELMVAGGQIMSRVWGGGIYEDDAFYDACDELGVLVWQDFMFGCGNYPVWPELLESVRQETVYNVERLRHHPSIVIYVGNNEDYQVQEQTGLTYNYEDKDPESWLKSDFPARYIYEKLLPELVSEYSPSTFYHPGSPWGDGKVSSDPTVGDIHQWNVWHGSQEKYQIFDALGGRFNSEFGMEAFPQISTIDYFLEQKKDRHPQSQVMDFHNKADGHERRLATYLVENLRLSTDLETYAYLTQVVQAETMMFGYGGWRRQWGDERKCGGALLWQINDCWPTISWAIADYFLRPKPAYYTVKRVMQPVVVGVRREHHDWSVVHAVPPQKSRYEMWVASSRQEVLHGTVELRFISVDTGKDLRTPAVFKDVAIIPNGTSEITSGVIDHVTEPEPHVLAARLWIDGQIVARDIDWPQPLKYLEFADRGLQVKQQPGASAGQQLLIISSQKPVKCLVFEERENVRISDSAIDVVPGDEQVIEVTGLSEGSSPLGYRYLGQ